MKITSLGIALCLIPVGLFGQLERCGYTNLLKHLEQNGQHAAVKEIQEEAYAFARNNGLQKTAPLYQIPVVVHIVYMSPSENLPDSLIQQQIQVLNADFRRTNADTSLTRSEFLPVAADAGIEFFLATLDPQGNPTTGITRTAGQPSGLFPIYDPFSDNVKKTALGGKDPWPTSRYLNVWVCNLLSGFGVLGYAYPPAGTPPNWPANSAPIDSNVQGVVIHYPVFGPKNPSATGALTAVNRGRTLTHEVGHFLGLRHIWGDGGCAEDDGLNDTPPSDSDAGQICDLSKNTCPPLTGPDLPDQIENYMDYAADSCMNMFSQEQVAAMHYILENYRKPLYQSGAQMELPIQTAIQIKVSPNPSKGAFTLHRSGWAGGAISAYISDGIGRHITEIKNINPGSYFQWETPFLPNGLYWCHISNGNQHLSLPILIQR
jgi:hypothetical protein